MCIRVNNVSDVLGLFSAVMYNARAMLHLDAIAGICNDAASDLGHAEECQRHLEAVQMAQLRLMAHRVGASLVMVVVHIRCQVSGKPHTSNRTCSFSDLFVLP